MPKTSYKQAIKDHVNKIGGNLIDQLEQNYYKKTEIPQWVNDIAVEHKKTSVQVLKDLTHYRNSWDYTKTMTTLERKKAK